MPRRINSGVIWGSVLILFLVLLGGVLFIFFTWQGKILPSVRIEWVKVGGLTEKEAEQQISRLGREFLAAPVQLLVDSKKFEITRSHLGFTVDTAASVRRAYLLGRSGNVWERCSQLWMGFRTQVVIPLEIRVDRRRAEKELTALLGEMISSPEDARLVINDQDEVVVVPGKAGKVVDVEGTLDDLSLFKKPFTRELNVRLQEKQPRLRTSDITAMGINGLLSSYSTYFDVKNTDRTYNIHVAADALNNTLIKPGEVFSFNEVVGPRSKEKGYREALVIVDDQYQPGLGGGGLSGIFDALQYSLAGRSGDSREEQPYPAGRLRPFGAGCNRRLRRLRSQVPQQHHQLSLHSHVCSGRQVDCENIRQ